MPSIETLHSPARPSRIHSMELLLHGPSRLLQTLCFESVRRERRYTITRISNAVPFMKNPNTTRKVCILPYLDKGDHPPRSLQSRSNTMTHTRMNRAHSWYWTMHVALQPIFYTKPPSSSVSLSPPPEFTNQRCLAQAYSSFKSAISPVPVPVSPNPICCPDAETQAHGNVVSIASQALPGAVHTLRFKSVAVIYLLGARSTLLHPSSPTSDAQHNHTVDLMTHCLSA